MAKKQKTESGYFWTKPNGDRFAVVYYIEAGKRKKKTRGIPAGTSKSKQYEILEELAEETKRATPAPESDSTSKRINGHTLTWKQLGQWYEDNFLQPARFNSDDKQIGGCLSWKHQRRRLWFVVASFGPAKRVRDLTPEQIRGWKEKRLATPVIKKQQRRDPITNAIVRDKAGKPVWETREIERQHGGVHRDLACLGVLLNKALEKGWITTSPWRKGFICPADEKKRETIMHQTEELSVLEHCRDTPKTRHLWIYLTVLFDSGCRSAEVRRLRVKHVDFERNEFLVASFKGGKRTERKIPLTPRARIVLLEACNPEVGPGKTPEDFVITYNLNCKQKDGSKKIEYRQLKAAPKRSWESAKRLAAFYSDNEINLAGVRLHDIRHTTLTRLVNSGAPLAEIMKFSGHTQMPTFLRYVNPDSTARAALADTLHNYHEAAVVQLADHKAKAKSA